MLVFKRTKGYIQTSKTPTKLNKEKNFIHLVNKKDCIIKLCGENTNNFEIHKYRNVL